MNAVQERPQRSKAALFKNEYINKDIKNILSRDITLPTKVRVVKAMVFPVVLCRYESQTVKNSLAAHQRINAFK